MLTCDSDISIPSVRPFVRLSVRPSVRPSVCPSVTLRYCIKMAQHIIVVSQRMAATHHSSFPSI